MSAEEIRVTNGKRETVRMLLKRPAVVVLPEQTLRSVAETLTEESIGAVVVRGSRPPDSSGSRAEGLVSERDIVRAVADGLSLDRTRAEEVMTLDLAFATPSDTIDAVATRMLENEIRHLPVLENGLVVGVISERDVLAMLTDCS
jgi:CBS domain-containing protein